MLRWYSSVIVLQPVPGYPYSGQPIRRSLQRVALTQQALLVCAMSEREHGKEEEVSEFQIFNSCSCTPTENQTRLLTILRNAANVLKVGECSSNYVTGLIPDSGSTVCALGFETLPYTA